MISLEQATSSTISGSVFTHAEVLLADLTGKNPNVFYELGLAHAARKPVVLITETLADVPFDLRAIRVIEYSPRLPSWDLKLREDITEALVATRASPAEFVLPTFLQVTSGSHPTVTADELRLLQLEQDLNSLRALVQSQGASVQSKGWINVPGYQLLSPVSPPMLSRAARVLQFCRHDRGDCKPLDVDPRA